MMFASINNHTTDSPGFWLALDRLVNESRVTIDRPTGTGHPRYPDFVYPLDYGYLEGTQAADGGGIDVWVGSEQGRRVVGVICTVDCTRRDTELKILLSCTPAEMTVILQTHNRGSQAGMLIPRPQNNGTTTGDET